MDYVFSYFYCLTNDLEISALSVKLDKEEDADSSNSEQPVPRPFSLLQTDDS